MASELSKTQIDRLGDRLKKGDITEAELLLLDSYRLTFTDAYEFVVGAIREKLMLEPTGRKAKTTKSIAEKLRRESIRLTQIQDIAGCRLTVSDVASQDSVVESLKSLFGHSVVVIDRRQKPSHGYRAIHVVTSFRGKLIEVQVRTELQHLWAELSEKLSDVWDPAIKYGRGDEKLQKALAKLSVGVSNKEYVETQMAELLEESSSLDILPVNFGERLEKLQHDVISEKQSLLKDLRDLIERAATLRGEKDVLSG